MPVKQTFSTGCYAVTFSEPVTGVTASDFQLALTDGITIGYPIARVSPGSGYHSVYNVTVFIVSGHGTLGLNLVDNGSIVDASGSHLANANGTFQPQQTFAADPLPDSVALADVNGDGKPDLVVGNEGSNTVSVSLGNGDGTFQPQKTFAAGAGTQSVSVADLNGDGKPDLVVVNCIDNTLSVLLGNGDGTFQPQNTYAVALDPGYVVVSDVNGDGKPDLLVNSQMNSCVNLLLGNGNGTFQAAKTISAGMMPWSIAVGDVNGDGKPDLVTADWVEIGVGIQLGNGDGTFHAQKLISLGMPYSYPTFVTLADVNGDGKLDIVVVNGVNNVGVLLGNGDGTFQSQQTFATGTVPGDIAVADVNGDGKPDLVVTEADSNAVGVLLGKGNGTFQAQQTFATGTGRPGFVAVADLNGDGRPDLVTTNANSNTVSVLLNNMAFTGQLYTIDSPTQLAFAQPPACTTVGKVINSLTGVQVAVENSSGAAMGNDSSAVTLTLSGGTFADGRTTESAAAINGVATFNNLTINAVGNYTLTASDGTLTGATSGSFMVCPLGDVIYAGFINSTNGAADIDAVYAHLGDTTGRYDLNGDGVVNQADVDCLVRTTLQTGYGDANLDHAVDFLDFQNLLNHWQLNGTGWAGCDFNGDGVTDFLDFQMMLNNWNPGGYIGTQQSFAPSTSPATEATAVTVAVASSTVATPLADLSAATAPAVSAAPVLTGDTINLLASETKPARTPRFDSGRSALRKLRHWTVSVQNDGADTVDLLTQLHSRPVVA